MPIRYIQLYPYTYYHIYNRGFDKQTIFYDHQDYDRFYKTMLRYNKDDFSKIDIASYCFLPNHFHFILISKSDDEYYISNFMRKLQQSYSQFFKIKHSLWKWQFFEWRFKSKPIQDEAYLQKCFVYVNFNPVKHWLVEDIKDWDYTSYHMLDETKKKQYLTLSEEIWILDDLEF